MGIVKSAPKHKELEIKNNDYKAEPASRVDDIPGALVKFFKTVEELEMKSRVIAAADEIKTQLIRYHYNYKAEPVSRVDDIPGVRVKFFKTVWPAEIYSILDKHRLDGTNFAFRETPEEGSYFELFICDYEALEKSGKFGIVRTILRKIDEKPQQKA